MPMPRSADIRLTLSPLRSFSDQQIGQKTVSGKKQRKISVVHSSPTVVLNAGTRKCRQTDRHSQYRPWRRIRRIQGVSTASLRHTHGVAPDSNHASRHAPLRTRLWFRLFNAHADSGAGMRPTHGFFDKLHRRPVSKRICAEKFDGRCVL
jgi:hypothetical protein